VKAENKQIYERRISKVNEMRRKYWSELRALRNDLLSKYRDSPDGSVNIIDSDAKELLQTVNDMWKSCVYEEMRRSSKTHKDGTGGLYTSDKLCKVCGLPLSGRQKAYCREECQDIARSRKWRTNNPDAKAKSNKKYLNKYY